MIAARWTAAALVALCVLGACGRKGDPIPPAPAAETQEQEATG